MCYATENIEFEIILSSDKDLTDPTRFAIAPGNGGRFGSPLFFCHQPRKPLS
jgi:hypothetical protein